MKEMGGSNPLWAQQPYGLLYQFVSASHSKIIWVASSYSSLQSQHIGSSSMRSILWRCVFRGRCPVRHSLFLLESDSISRTQWFFLPLLFCVSMALNCPSLKGGVHGLQANELTANNFVTQAYKWKLKMYLKFY